MGQQEGPHSRRHAAVAAAAHPTARTTSPTLNTPYPAPSPASTSNRTPNVTPPPPPPPAEPDRNRDSDSIGSAVRARRLLHTDRGAPLARSHRAKPRAHRLNPRVPGSVANLKRRPRGDSSSYGGNASPETTTLGPKNRDKSRDARSALVPPRRRRRNGRGNGRAPRAPARLDRPPSASSSSVHQALEVVHAGLAHQQYLRAVGEPDGGRRTRLRFVVVVVVCGGSSDRSARARALTNQRARRADRGGEPRVDVVARASRSRECPRRTGGRSRRCRLPPFDPRERDLAPTELRLPEHAHAHHPGVHVDHRRELHETRARSLMQDDAPGAIPAPTPCRTGGRWDRGATNRTGAKTPPRSSGDTRKRSRRSPSA